MSSGLSVVKTQTAAMTWGYTASEVMQGIVSAKADVFSFGVVRFFFSLLYIKTSRSSCLLLLGDDGSIHSTSCL